MNKGQQEAWDLLVEECQKHIWDVSREDAILTADVYIRKLERELQALKHKKAVAAILQKNFK